MYKDIDYNALTKAELSSERNKRRKQLFNIATNINLIAKGLREGDLKKECKDFITLYKSRYVVNDFSLHSVFTGTNKAEINSITCMINVIKEVIAK